MTNEYMTEHFQLAYDRKLQMSNIMTQNWQIKSRREKKKKKLIASQFLYQKEKAKKKKNSSGCNQFLYFDFICTTLSFIVKNEFIIKYRI